jgi:hypothetical protein
MDAHREMTEFGVSPHMYQKKIIILVIYERKYKLNCHLVVRFRQL